MSANPHGLKMPRAELHTKVVQLKDAGLTFKEIAAYLERSLSSITDAYYDPSGDRARARKRKRHGVCVGCGCDTFNSGSEPGKRCLSCDAIHRREMSRRWIIESIGEWMELFGVPPTATEWSPARARKIGQAQLAERYAATGRSWPSPSLVQDNFGSWNAGIEAAGWDPRPVGHYGREGEDPAVIEDTARRYLAGMSSCVIAAEDGVSDSCVRWRLEIAGVPRRSYSEAHAVRRARQMAGGSDV